MHIIGACCGSLQSTMSVVELRCEGAFGFIWLPHAFTFHVYPDAGLLADVTWRNSLLSSQQEEGDQAPRHEEEESIMYFVTGGSAQRVPDATELVFDVEFTVVHWDGVWLQRSLMKCAGRLSSARGLEGRFSHYHDVNAAEASTVFSLAPVSCRPPRHLALQKQCFPLTPGLYELRGFVYGAESNTSYYVLEMQLLPDGHLVGTARDAAFPFEDKLTGTWTRDNMQCLLEYQEEDGGMSSDSYVCAPTLAGMRGSWQRLTTDSVSGTPDEDPDLHGWLEFRLERSQRQWWPSAHRDFPQPFQQITKLLLLASHRAPARSAYALPTAIWQHVLRYCDYDWFGHDSDHELVRNCT